METKRKPRKKLITYLVLVVALLALVGWRVDLSLSKGYDTTLEVSADDKTETYLGGIKERRVDQKIRLNATVKDGQGNSMPTQEIFAEIIEGEGLIEMWNKFTDNRGISTFDYISGINPGRVVVEVSNLSSKSGEVVTIVLNVADRGIKDENLVMDITFEPAKVIAGEIAVITVKVSSEGKLVPKHTIEFNIAGGKGTLRLLRQQVVDTDENGEAKVKYTTSTVPETSILLIRDVSVDPPIEQNIEITTVKE